MSVYVYCQALPETSPLLERLRIDAQSRLLYAALLPLGNGPFYPPELDSEELAETIAFLEETESTVFAAPGSAARATEPLFREIEVARGQYPGIELRACFLDKTYEEIYERLSIRLAADHQDDMLSQLSFLFSGDKSAMAPAGKDGSAGGLGLLRANIVHQAASVLRHLPAEALFDPETEDWLADDYDGWRSVFLEAARHDEAILVG